MFLNRVFKMNISKRNIGSRHKLTLVSKVKEFMQKVKNFETPERLKGTVVERWGIYWKNLCIDYKDVAIDVVKDCRARPIRALAYASIIGGSYHLGKHNPDEQSFRQQLIENSSQVMQIGEPVRNPISTNHIKWLEQCYNEGIIRWFSFGIISVVWLDNYSEDCAIYKATCSYLKPEYLKFYERIIDIGCYDTWWLLKNKMTDYDVNEEEFITRQLEN